jgi:hypothetical protein
MLERYGSGRLSAAQIFAPAVELAGVAMGCRVIRAPVYISVVIFYRT